MGSYGGNAQEERLLRGDGIIQKTKCFLRGYIYRVAAFVAHWRVVISLVGGVEIGIRVGIEQEVGSVESSNVWGIVVVHGVCIEQLAHVVCLISSALQPDWKEIGIESSFHEFRISTCGNDKTKATEQSGVKVANRMAG